MMTNVSEELVASIFRVSAFPSGHGVLSTRTFKLCDVRMNFPQFFFEYLKNINSHAKCEEHDMCTKVFYPFLSEHFFAQLLAP